MRRENEHEYQEQERQIPTVTAYILRHGETTEDKSDPRRGLTLKGEQQIDAAAERLIKELDVKRDLIQIFDSGNHRATVSVLRIAEKLKEAGFQFFEPVEVNPRREFQSVNKSISTTDQPKVRTLHKGAGAADIPDYFRKNLEDPEFHQALGIPDSIEDKRLITWFLADLPDDVEKPQEVVDRVEGAMSKTQKQLPQLQHLLGTDKRIVAIVGANASVVDAMIVDRTKVPVTARGGETPNAEGFKLDFHSEKDAPLFSVWGETIEKQIHEKN